jgi:DNA polymerase III alpha subunit
MTLAQLRCRTEFTFREAFGPVGRVADALAAIGAPAAGMVDGGTHGHTRWAKELKKRSLRPLFGTALAFPQADGKKPVAWALAASAPGFYRFSTAARRAEADLPALFSGFSRDLVRFAGSALTDPECFDYVDMNPASPLAQRAARRLAAATGKPLVVTSDNRYPAATDVRAFLAMGGREQITPQHLLGEAELRAALLPMSDAEWARVVASTNEAAERCASELTTAPLIHYPGDLRAMSLVGKAYRLAAGHIAAWTDEYEARLERELKMIAEKRYDSYFFVVADLVQWAKERMLVGPARGSSAGSLVCYLLRITEIDPLRHELLFERFIDVSRNDLPDIDIDFNDQKRDLIFDYLAEKYGRENVARIGNINTLKPRSVMMEVCKRMGIPEGEKFAVMNVLIEYSSGDSRYGKGLEDTLKGTEPGKRFAARYPEGAVMFELENHAWHTGVHAAGVIVCNEPISNFCTVTPEGVIHGDKPVSEALGLLKIDALGLRTLGIIEDAGVVTPEQLYALDLADPEVLKVFNDRRYAGIFQFEGPAQRRVSAEVEIKSFREIDHVTALARPGPLGGGASQHYIARAKGNEPVTYRHPSMEAYLSRTMGVVLYQEQVMRICFEIGKFSWEVVSEIRKSMSGRKGKEYFDRRGDEFVAGAASIGVPKEDAELIWAEICTFGAWGMNASHTVSYGVISYWCAWMKRYHPVEFAAACLRSAKDDEQTLEILRDMSREGVRYVPFDVNRSAVHWAAVDGELIGGFQNLKGFGPAKATAAVEARASGRLAKDEKLLARIAAAEVKFSDLTPVYNAWRDLYLNPERYGCREGSVVRRIDELSDREDALIIGRMVQLKLRDKNEAILVARRGGKIMPPPTIFLDINVTDDSGVPITLRVDPSDYEAIGKVAAANLQPGDDLLVRGWKIPEFSMLKVTRMRCLNRPEALGDGPMVVAPRHDEEVERAAA